MAYQSDTTTVHVSFKDSTEDGEEFQQFAEANKSNSPSFSSIEMKFHDPPQNTWKNFPPVGYFKLKNRKYPTEKILLLRVSEKC